MDGRRGNEATPMKNQTTLDRKSGRELVVTRTFDAPPRIVFKAGTQPEEFVKGGAPKSVGGSWLEWGVPKSFGGALVSWEADIRPGGKYRFVFKHGSSDPMAFFGTYVEVTPHSRLVWTNEEGADGQVVTTVTFEAKGGKTLLVMHDLYPSKEALDAAMASGEKSCM